MQQRLKTNINENILQYSHVKEASELYSPPVL
jgi:hypothetical protein